MRKYYKKLLTVFVATFCQYSFFLEFLVEAVYLSVDPYMRAYVSGLKLGQTMIGCQVAKYINAISGLTKKFKHVLN